MYDAVVEYGSLSLHVELILNMMMALRSTIMFIVLYGTVFANLKKSLLVIINTVFTRIARARVIFLRHGIG